MSVKESHKSQATGIDQYPVGVQFEDGIISYEDFRESQTAQDILDDVPQMDPRVLVIQSDDANEAQKAEALNAIIEEYSPILLEYISKRVRSRHVAEDILQETLISAARNIGNLEKRGNAPLLAWLYKVASSRTINEMKRPFQSLEASSEYMDVFDEIGVLGRRPQDPQEVVEQKEEFELLKEALEKLRPEQRRVILLIESGKSQGEIAQIIGKSYGATRSVIHRARLRIKNHMED